LVPIQTTKASFKELLDGKSLEYFNEKCKAPFSEQACFFMNAFWDEIGDQAEVIYNVHWEILKMADMRWKNCSYIHLYEEGDDIDFDTTLYFFEQVCKFFDQDKNKKWADDYPAAIPEMKTSIVRKKEIRDEVDLNFDNRISFLEYLLYQYRVSPKDLMSRTYERKSAPVNQMLLDAQAALAAVNEAIKAYEAEKFRLEEEVKLGGVKGLRATNMLAQLASGPLVEDLRRRLITAEAAVRKAVKASGQPADYKGNEGEEQATPMPTAGSIWWLQRDLKTKKEKYGK
jgi:hypothetical protein